MMARADEDDVEDDPGIFLFFFVLAASNGGSKFAKGFAAADSPASYVARCEMSSHLRVQDTDRSEKSDKHLA